MLCRQRIRFLACGVFCSLLLLFATLLFAKSSERVTDEMISRWYGRHRIMSDQRRRLRELGDAFLLGDEEGIRRNAKEIAGSMREIERQYPPEIGKEDKQWRIMAEIIESARLMDEAASQKKYLQAYQQMTTIGSSCIACHQERRSWGTFPEPKQEPTPEPVKQPAAKK